MEISPTSTRKKTELTPHFKVITVKQCKEITFESIDFFKDSSNGINKQGPYPCVSRLPKIRRTVQYIYLTALALLGLCMLIFPRQLWKISNFLWTKKEIRAIIHILNENKRCRLLVLALILLNFCRLQ